MSAFYTGAFAEVAFSNAAFAMSDVAPVFLPAATRRTIEVSANRTIEVENSRTVRTIDA